MKTLHPALALYKSLFDKVAAEGSPVNPTHYVPRSWFVVKCREAGIEVPENVVKMWEWEQQIGLNKFAEKLIRAHHKAHGTDFTPMEKASMRLTRKLQAA